MPQKMSCVEKRLDHPGGFDSTAPILLNFTMNKDVTNCWFNIRLDEPDSAVGANSPNFQFNSTKGGQKTFSLGSATSPTSSSPASTQSGVSANPTVSSTSGATPSAPSPSPDSSASAARSGLSTGAQAGIGVGVGLAGIAIGAAAVALVYNRRRKQRGGGGDGPGENAFSGSSQYRPTAAPSPNAIITSSSSPPYQKSGYYAQVPNSDIHEAQFQDAASKLQLGQVYVAYDRSVGQDAQKFRGAPIGSRHEMDGTPANAFGNVHEMP
ncbi:hypothetical protein F5Y13DRAFT_161151 [Hypoxylon sp. FL1857]|nr:hypothetical protein F5Y13DRAFT_161151 [Hypoxylon sp. FL1857]